MIISIHQPNFIPWYPFFDKIKRSDVFVILTHCQYEKNNYQNRFNYNNRWHTMSVNRGIEPIINKKYINYEKDWNKICANLIEKKDILSLFDEYIGENLVEVNNNIILKICDLLDIKTKIVFDYKTDLRGNERLIDICEKYKASTYLAGVGSKKYLDTNLFYEKSINVIFQDIEKVSKESILNILEKK